MLVAVVGCVKHVGVWFYCQQNCQSSAALFSGSKEEEKNSADIRTSVMKSKIVFGVIVSLLFLAWSSLKGVGGPNAVDLCA